MKDPFQKEATPYEILDVGFEATDAEIFAAFTAGMTARRNVQQLRAAKQILDRPADRALVDLMQYDPSSLRGLAPSALEDPSVLDETNRGATAAAWEATLKDTFPNIGATHSLAVLWYWWALHEEERIGSAGSQPITDRDVTLAPDATELWERSIECWSSLIASDEFWESRPRIGREKGHAIGERLIAMLQGRLDGFAGANRARGETSRAEEYHRLGLTFSVDVNTARSLAAAGISLGNGRICAGRLLLGRLHLLDDVLRVVDEGIAADPTDAGLSALRTALSPYGHVDALIREGRAQEALEEIGRLPTVDDPTAADLEARALIELGKQQNSMGQTDEALTRWSAAIEKAASDTVKADARSAIVSACRDRAASLSHTNIDEAIELLKRGLTLVADEQLRSTLGEFLFQRGMKPYMAVQDRLETEPGPVSKDVIRELERGLEDLEHGERLGSARAAEQVKGARSFLEQVRSGLIGLPKEVENLLAEANKAAERNEWDTAIDRFRAAVKALGANVPAQLRKNLSVLLSNRANQNASKAMAMRGQTQSLIGLVGNPMQNAYLAVMADEKVESKARRKAVPKGRKFGEWVLEGSIGNLLWWIMILGASLGGGDKASERWLRTNPIGKTLFIAGFTILGMSVLLLLIRLGKALVDWVARTTAPFDVTRRSYSYSAPREPEERCFCGSGASYQLTLEPGKTVNLCFTHKDALEKKLNALPPAATAMLEAAEDDFEEAAAWDPSTKEVRESLTAVRQMLGRTTTQTRPGRTPRTVPAAPAAIASKPAASTSGYKQSGVGRDTPKKTRSTPRAASTPSKPAATQKRSTSTPGARAAPRPKAAGAKVNLNTATAEELAMVPGVDGELAVRIVGYREANGEFSWAEQVKRVPGVTDEIYMKLREHVKTRYLP